MPVVSVDRIDVEVVTAEVDGDLDVGSAPARTHLCRLQLTEESSADLVNHLGTSWKRDPVKGVHPGKSIFDVAGV